jgi:SAM-dependent methyltransferase
MSNECILCGSDQTSTVEEINVADLTRIYRQRSNLDVSPYFDSSQIDVRSCADCDLMFYTPGAIGDGPFYDELQKHPFYYMRGKAEFHEAAKWIRPTDDVLEIGCGSGNFASVIECRSYTGLEFSREAVDKSVAAGLNVHSQAIREHAGAYQARYDVVCYFQVLEHVEKPGEFIADSLRCLRPGGRLILAVPSQDSFIRNAENFYLNMPPHHASKWTDRSLSALARLHRLELVYLFHEPLNDAHEIFFLKTKLYTKLRNAMRRSYRSVDPGPLGSWLHVASVAGAYMARPMWKRSDDEYGQSVMAVYAKR